MTVRDWLDGEGALFRDGGMGTMLMASGLVPGQSGEDFNVLHPERVRAIHDAYTAAGADFVLSNTFGGNALRHKNGKYPLADVLSSGMRLAREAADRADHPCFALFDVGPLGVLLEPLGDLEESEATGLFAEAIEIGANAGADAILIETMGDLAEMRAAIAAAKSVCDLPVIATLTFDQNARLFTGHDVRTAIRQLSSLPVDMVGCNCGVGPEQIVSMLPAILESAAKPIAIAPNAGLPVLENGEARYTLSPEEFALDMEKMFRAGVRLLGGCCGTTPAHIRAMVERCKSSKN